LPEALLDDGFRAGELLPCRSADEAGEIGMTVRVSANFHVTCLHRARMVPLHGADRIGIAGPEAREPPEHLGILFQQARRNEERAGQPTLTEERKRILVVVEIAVIERDGDSRALVGDQCRADGRDVLQRNDATVPNEPVQMTGEQLRRCGGERLVRVNRVIAEHDRAAVRGTPQPLRVDTRQYCLEALAQRFSHRGGRRHAGGVHRGRTGARLARRRHLRVPPMLQGKRYSTLGAPPHERAGYRAHWQ